MNDDNPFGGDYPILTPEQRRETLHTFLAWFVQQSEGLLLAVDPQTHLREVVTDEEIRALISSYENWESDQGVAAMERQQEGY